MALKINIRAFLGKKILVAPLDWGLGHATRCIPIIRKLLEAGCDVSLAGEGAQEILLKKEFPGIPFLPLKGYRIHYGKKNTIGKILSQVPKILSAIRYEKKWLEQQLNQHQFDVVISDNRYGLFNHNIQCIFLTHQLKIKSPYGRWSESVLQHWNYKYINQFNECWIPDGNTAVNLAGELSHPEILPRTPLMYIGPLTRFEKKSIPEKPGHLLVVVSGPEPQRTIFENLVMKQFHQLSGTLTCVRGLPDSQDDIPSTEKINYYNHLDSQALLEEIEKAEFVISRAGYSSIMDLTCLKKKSILVPTPGQTEQEYLAKYLFEKKLIFAVSQHDFSLQKNVEEASRFNYQFIE